MLLRIAPNSPGAEDDLSALTGGALLTAPSVSLDSDTLSGDRVFAAASTDVTLSGVTTGSSRVVLKGAENAALRVQNDSTLSTIALDPAGAATASLTGGSSAETLVIAGRGGDVTVSGPCENIEITAANRTIRLSNTAADTMTVTGSGNTIVVDGTVGAVSVNAGAKNNTLTLNGSVDTLVAAGIGAKIGGSGKAKSIDVRAANCTVTLKADSKIENVDTGLAGVTIRLGVPTRVTAGRLAADAGILRRRGRGKDLHRAVVSGRQGARRLQEHALYAEARRDLQPYLDLYLYQKYEDQRYGRLQAHLRESLHG